MKPKTIVLFSASRATQEVVASAVLECRHGLRLASDMERAIAILSHDRSDVDLFILDLDEQIHGVTLLAMLNVVIDRAPVILLTGSDPDYNGAIDLQANADLCLQKPVSVPEIRAALSHILRPALPPPNEPAPFLWPKVGPAQSGFQEIAAREQTATSLPQGMASGGEGATR